MATPLHPGKYLTRRVKIALTGQRFGVVDAEVIPATVCPVGESGNRAAKTLGSGVQISVSQGRHPANGLGEGLGGARDVRTLLEATVSDRQGF